jgi:hypothetical protein
VTYAPAWLALAALLLGLPWPVWASLWLLGLALTIRAEQRACHRH